MSDPSASDPEPSPVMNQPLVFPSSNISLINENEEEEEEEVNAKMPGIAMIGAAALSGFIVGLFIFYFNYNSKSIGNITPRLSRMFIYSSLTSTVVIPSLIYAQVLEVTDHGKKKMGDVKDMLQDSSGVEDFKKKGIRFVKKNILTSLVFSGCFLFGLNLYYKSRK